MQAVLCDPVTLTAVSDNLIKMISLSNNVIKCNYCDYNATALNVDCKIEDNKVLFMVEDSLLAALNEHFKLHKFEVALLE